MSTTTLFIELLLTGLQVGIWLLLLVFSVFGMSWVNLERIKGFETVIAVVVLSLIYPMGVIVDYVAANIFRPRELKIRQIYIRDRTQSLTRFLLIVREEAITHQLGYFRSRIRICRSAALNFVLITFGSVILVISRFRYHPDFPFWRIICFAIILGLSLTVLAAFAWEHINRQFYKWMARGYNPTAYITDKGILEDTAVEAEVMVSEVSHS